MRAPTLEAILITVHISGGLGNQLFQYAAGLALATRRKTALRLETRKFRKAGASEDPASRPLRILDFDLPFRTLSTRMQEETARHRWNMAKNLHMPPRWFGFYVEPGFRFDPKFHDLKDGVRLQGYFQSEAYFADIKPAVRDAFRPLDKSLLAAIDARLASLREPGRPLVALHVRRGDFLELTDRDCLTSDEFMEAAMAEFSDAAFLVFSDDIDWCRTRFAGMSNVMLSPFTRVIEDFLAMARCDHNILAKSTFSWWAAWLNENEGRRVVAPFIASGETPTWGGGSPDYYPEGWTIIR